MAWRSLLSKECYLPERVYILDTTLRDGEQTPGVALTPEEKVEIAAQLDRLGVDVIEAGFPVVSRGEREAVKGIAEQGFKAEIMGLARAVRKDVDAALACDVDCVHIFIATSEIHMRKKLKKTREEVLEAAVKEVEYAKSHGVKVEFSPEDATRTKQDFLIQVCRAVEEAGTDRINIPDTVGVILPRAMFNLIRGVKENVKVPIAVHCHDDMGLAVANSLASVEAGAEEIHVCVNGLGERAGNASLEEVAVSLHFLYGVKTGIILKELYNTSQLVMKMTGIILQPNKAIVGDNAFSHESGIHTHGVITSPETYEPLLPEVVGHRRRLLAGKHAGKHGIETMLKELGFTLTETQLNEVIARVKELGDKGRTVTDTDLTNIVEVVTGTIAPELRKIELKDFVVVTGNKTTPTATIRLSINGKEYKSSDFGVGPIDAAVKAVRNTIGDVTQFKLVEFRLEAITGGTDALANVVVKMMDDRGRLVSARGVREDIVLAGVEAIINAANRLLYLQSLDKKE